MKKWKWILLFNIAFILILKTPLGVEVNGNRAWLDIPLLPVNIQPAEIVKLTFILLLAQQLVWLKENRDLKSLSSIAFLGGHLALIAGLYVLVSSDMGSTLVYVFAFAAMAYAAGVALRWFVMALLGARAYCIPAQKGGDVFTFFIHQDALSFAKKEQHRPNY